MKKNLKTIAASLLALLFPLTIASCDNTSSSTSSSSPESSSSFVNQSNEVTSDSLYVKKVENLSEDFIMGMDASCVPSLEAGGVEYYDFEGNKKDVFEVLANNGINYIRVRVWNDPFNADGKGYGGGNCDINTALEIGKRATQFGMKLLVDFHYSDFWADPAKQMCPKAWVGMNIDDKAMALQTYTKESLQLLKDNNVDVGMVQLGNETNGKMAGEKTWFNMAKLWIGGSRAVREVFPEALIALHFTNPEKISNYREYASKLAYYEKQANMKIYDVFASSYYPYWHGTVENLTSLLTEIAETYDKKVMIAETSYAFTSEDTDFYGNTISDGGAIKRDYPFSMQGQANSVRNLIDAVQNKMKNGIGVFYWEGTWISSGGATYEENKALWEEHGSGWASSYAAEYDPNDAGKYYGGCSVDNQAFFDKDGHPLESLKVFALSRKGNESVPVSPDAIADTTIICDLNGEIVLPTKVDAVMTDNSRQSIDVEWTHYQVTDANYNTTVYDKVDFDAFRNGGPKKYDIVGVAGGMEAHCYLSMIEFNFITNYSFEDNANGDKVPTGWTVEELGKADELHVEDKATDSLTGSLHYHFWSGTANTVEFYLEQEIKDLPAGKYKYSISIMGGDAGTTNIYSYVKINGEIVKTTPLQITSYGSWDTQVINDIEYDGTSTISVGIFVKCEGSGNGAWGKIDDALFNSVKD